MTLVVVLFETRKDGTVDLEVGRQSWMASKNSIYWPKMSFAQAIKNPGILPDKSWTQYNVTVLKSGIGKFFIDIKIFYTSNTHNLVFFNVFFKIY